MIFSGSDGLLQKLDADGVFSKVANLYFNDDKVRFNTNDTDYRNDNFGVASGFPRSLFFKTMWAPV